MEDNTEAIESVLVIPHNRLFGHFFLNASDEAHSLRYDDLEKYLIQLDPRNAMKIREHMGDKRIFMLFPKDHEVVVLEADELTPEDMQQQQIEALKNVPRKQTKKNTLSEKASRLVNTLGKNSNPFRPPRNS